MTVLAMSVEYRDYGCDVIFVMRKLNFSLEERVLILFWNSIHLSCFTLHPRRVEKRQFF
jgi:hypothetical protein